jgi:large subunit ribosomal protein L21
MFAIIETGGKQYSVKEGTKLAIERMEGELGSIITIDTVLAVTGKVGAPYVKGASVSAKIIDHYRDDKVLVFKKKRRQNYRRLNGHRHHRTMLQIEKIAV